MQYSFQICYSCAACAIDAVITVGWHALDSLLLQVVWFLQLKHMKGNKNIKLHLWTIIKVCSDVFFSVTSALCHCWNKQGVSCFTQGLNLPTTPRERAQVNFVLSIISTQEASPRWNDQYRTSSRRNEFVGALCASADTSECVNCFQSETTRTQTHTHAHTQPLCFYSQRGRLQRKSVVTSVLVKNETGWHLWELVLETTEEITAWLLTQSLKAHITIKKDNVYKQGEQR